jgi:hypothetical protein
MLMHLTCNITNTNFVCTIHSTPPNFSISRLNPSTEVRPLHYNFRNSFLYSMQKQSILYYFTLFTSQSCIFSPTFLYQKDERALSRKLHCHKMLLAVFSPTPPPPPSFFLIIFLSAFTPCFKGRTLLNSSKFVRVQVEYDDFSLTVAFILVSASTNMSGCSWTDLIKSYMCRWCLLKDLKPIRNLNIFNKGKVCPVYRHIVVMEA